LSNVISLGKILTHGERPRLMREVLVDALGWPTWVYRQPASAARWPWRATWRIRITPAAIRDAADAEGHPLALAVGLIGAIPAVICSWIVDKITNPVQESRRA
jgi:hypothetical protein